MFECFVSSWWNSLGKFKRHGHVGGSEILGVSLKFQKPVPVIVALCAYCLWISCIYGGKLQLVLHHHVCLSVPMFFIRMIMESLSATVTHKKAVSSVSCHRQGILAK